MWAGKCAGLGERRVWGDFCSPSLRNSLGRFVQYRNDHAGAWRVVDGPMDEIAASVSDGQTAELLEELQRMEGEKCQECTAELCGHEALMSIVAGYKHAPRCLSCLSQLMGRGREEVRDHLLGYILSRPCRHAGWTWANRQEATEPSALPKCLWPSVQILCEEETLMRTTDGSTESSSPNPVPDSHWDAGNIGCGELVMGLRMRLQSLEPGQILKLTATDAGIPEDLPAWCRLTGHTLVYANHPEYWIRRKEN